MTNAAVVERACDHRELVWSSADVVVVRVGSLPAAAALSDGFAAVAHRIDELLAAHDRAAALAGPLSEALYALVPALDAHQRIRRAALRLRRSVHNGRFDERVGQDARDVLAHLPAPAAELLSAWLSVVQDLSVQGQRLAGELAVTVRARGQEILELLRRPHIMHGLSVASPAFQHELARHTGELHAQQRLARSAYSYLTRCAAKTSPFSSLTTVAVLPGPGPRPGAGHPDGPQPDLVNRVQPLPLAVSLLLACAADERFDDVFDLALTRAVAREGTGQSSAMVALLPLGLCADGFFFAEDEVVRLGPGADEVLRHPQFVSTVTGWSERLGKPPSAVRRMVATGLLQPSAVWDGGTSPGSFVSQLAAHLRCRACSAHAQEIVERVADVAVACQAADHDDPAVRATADRRTRAAGRKAFAALGLPRPGWLDSAPLFHETVATVAPVDTLPGATSVHLGHLAAAAAASTRRTALYEGLVQAFTGQYGRGGTCPRILDFLLGVMAAPGFPADLSRAVREDGAGTWRAASDTSGRGTLAPPTLTVFFQLARAAARDEQSLTVINRVNSGPGGLLARWAHVPALNEDLAGGLTAWLRSLHPDCLVLATTTSAGWASVQRLPEGIPALRWPTQLPGPGPEGPAVELSHIGLRHEPRHGTLQAFRVRDGQPVAFPYLGVIPVHLVTGAARLLLTLTDPWINSLRIDGERRVFDSPLSPATAVSEQARQQEDGLVMSRRRWRIPAGSLTGALAGSDPVAVLAAVRRWQRANGLPDVLFARTAGGSRPAKPCLLDLRDPFSIASVLKPDAAGELEFVEALPGPHDGWVRDEHGERTVAEFVTVLALGAGQPC